MRIYIIYSGGSVPREKEPFTVTFDDTFARRVIRHIQDDQSLCDGCGSKCVSCRLSYKIAFGEHIVGTHQLPPVMEHYVDNPRQHLPEDIPAHDVLLAINVHEDILMSLPGRAKEAGARAFIVPVESPEWLSRGARTQLRKACVKLGLESAYPKPFCALEQKPEHPFINEFMKFFRIGKPEIKFTIKNGVIDYARVLQCAPCGNTYFVAHNLKGVSVDDKQKLHDVVAKYWHSYPCVASMKIDPELQDTILHKGGYMHYDCVDKAKAEAEGESAVKS